jgi:hypothetical protein
MVYRVPEFLCCRLIWDHPPPSPASECTVLELYIQGVQRQREGEAISHGKGCWGTQIGERMETLVLYVFSILQGVIEMSSILTDQ